MICGNPVRALRARKQHGLKSSSAIPHRPATTTPTSGYRLHDLKLEYESCTINLILSLFSDFTCCFFIVTTLASLTHLCYSPVCEDVVITRSKSEERLFLEEESEYPWQPDHLSLSANTSQMSSSPTHSSQSPSSLHQYSYTAHPTTPSPDHTHHNPRQPTPPQAPPPDSATGISKSVASYRLRRFKRLSNEPV